MRWGCWLGVIGGVVEIVSIVVVDWCRARTVTEFHIGIVVVMVKMVVVAVVAIGVLLSIVVWPR